MSENYILDQLNKLNSDITILSADEPLFREYGMIHSSLKDGSPEGGLLFKKALELFGESEGTSYIASSPELEACPETAVIKRRIFGEAEIQAGCCWGYNTKMNGMEYHRSSEVIGAATDMVLILGRVQEMRNNRWDSSNARFFYLPAGTMAEIYPSTLHLAPCRVARNPFCAVIFLPAGTNTPLGSPPEETLWMKNKWLIAHPEGPAASRGAHIGIDGVNPEVLSL